MPNPTDLFYQIIERYSPHVIRNIFFGHTHEVSGFSRWLITTDSSLGLYLCLLRQQRHKHIRADRIGSRQRRTFYYPTDQSQQRLPHVRSRHWLLGYLRVLHILRRRRLLSQPHVRGPNIRNRILHPRDLRAIDQVAGNRTIKRNFLASGIRAD